MNQKAYLRHVGGLIERFGHPYLQATLTEDGIDAGMFRGRFGMFLDRAEERGIISGRERKVLYKHCGVSGGPKTLREINLPSKKSGETVTAEKVRQIEARAYERLTGDPRSREILDGLYTGSYSWPRPVGDWHPLDLVPSLAGDPNLFRFLSSVGAETVSGLLGFTERDLSYAKYYGPVNLRRLKKILARHNLRLSALDVYMITDDEADSIPGLVRGFMQKPVSRREILSLLNHYPTGSGVMVVDDNMDVGRAMGETISSLGYTPIVCSGGREALEKYTDDMPLVITDSDMPGMNGIELARKLKEKEGGKV